MRQGQSLLRFQAVGPRPHRTQERVEGAYRKVQLSAAADHPQGRAPDSLLAHFSYNYPPSERRAAYILEYLLQVWHSPSPACPFLLSPGASRRVSFLPLVWLYPQVQAGGQGRKVALCQRLRRFCRQI